jgi:hypothetical protein
MGPPRGLPRGARVARFVHAAPNAATTRQVTTTLLRREKNGTIRNEKPITTAITVDPPDHASPPTHDVEDAQAQLDHLLLELDHLLLGESPPDHASPNETPSKPPSKKSKNGKSVSVRIVSFGSLCGPHVSTRYRTSYKHGLVNDKRMLIVLWRTKSLLAPRHAVRMCRLINASTGVATALAVCDTVGSA